MSKMKGNFRRVSQSRDSAPSGIREVILTKTSIGTDKRLNISQSELEARISNAKINTQRSKLVDSIQKSIVQGSSTTD